MGTSLGEQAWRLLPYLEKEEVLEFGTVKEEEVRILGNWMGEKIDESNRIRRIGELRQSVKWWLKGSKLSKRWQGRIVQACVVSSLLYDCQATVWYKRDMSGLKRCMNKFTGLFGVTEMVNPCDRWLRDM